MSKPKVLFLDIETSPMEVYAWGLYDQNFGLNQIKEDWSILAFCAKWEGSKELIYRDQRNAKNLRNEKKLLPKLHALLDEADIVVTQNGIRFDAPKINARLVMAGFEPPSPYRHIDTKVLAKKFGFTSRSLEYMAKALKTEHQKLVDREYVGQDLWTACLAREPKAWREMEKYNKHDVIVLEEIYQKLRPWGTNVNFGVYENSLCACGSKKFERRGFKATQAGLYQQYKCGGCGAWSRGAENLLDKQTRAKVRRSA